LRAVKPKRGVDLDFELPEDDTGVVLVVELVEPGIESSVLGGAGLIEGGFGDGVVGAVEVEADDVSDCGVDVVPGIFELAISADNDVVGFHCAVGGACGSCAVRELRDPGWLDISLCRGDCRCSSVDDLDIDVDDDHVDSVVLVDRDSAVVARRACGINPNGGRGPGVVDRCDRAAIGSNIWRRVAPGVCWDIGVSSVRRCCDGDRLSDSGWVGISADDSGSDSEKCAERWDGGEFHVGRKKGIIEDCNGRK